MVYNTYRWLTADRLNENFSIYDVWKTDQTRFEFCTSFRIESIPNFTKRATILQLCFLIEESGKIALEKLILKLRNGTLLILQM